MDPNGGFLKWGIPRTNGLGTYIVGKIEMGWSTDLRVEFQNLNEFESALTGFCGYLLGINQYTLSSVNIFKDRFMEILVHGYFVAVFHWIFNRRRGSLRRDIQCQGGEWE